MAKENSTSLDNIIKKYGDIISGGKEILNKKKQVISISPMVDIALSGGIPEGSFVSLAGPSGCGKSTTALQIIKNALDVLYEGQKRKVFYLDIEHRLKRMNLEGIKGLNPDDVTVIRSTPDRILTGENFCDIAEALMRDKDNRGCVIVLDSTSKLCPANEMESETKGTLRASAPKLLSHFLNKVSAVINVMDITFVAIQHVITNTSGYGETFLVDGGEKIKYQCDVKLVTKGKPPVWDYKGKPIGQIVEWTVIKSALGQPLLPCKSYLRYGEGLDALKEYLALGVELGVINKAGSWYSFDGKKYQGEEGMYQAIVDDKKMQDDIIKQVREFIQ